MTQIGFLAFPHLTQLDMTGPYEVLARGPGVQTHVIWKTRDPITADSGLCIVPSTTFDDCPPLDVLVVPGGTRGVRELLDDEETLEFLRVQAASCTHVTSVCTGALILGAAGLLEGYDATTHWSATGELARYGARYVPGRVVHDRDRITVGGVTAGIDFGLTLASLLWGEAFAQGLQLGLEYDPAPPFDAGSPETAPPGVVELVKVMLEAR